MEIKFNNKMKYIDSNPRWSLFRIFICPKKFITNVDSIFTRKYSIHSLFCWCIM